MVEVDTSEVITESEEVLVESDESVINRERGEEMGEVSEVEEKGRELKNEDGGDLYDDDDDLENGNGNGGGGW